MRSTPILDALQFLIGNTPDHDSLGPAAIALVVVYAALLLGSIAIAALVLAQQPGQRNVRSVTIWPARLHDVVLGVAVEAAPAGSAPCCTGSSCLTTPAAALGSPPCAGPGAIPAPG